MNFLLQPEKDAGNSTGPGAVAAMRAERLMAEARCWIGTRFVHQGRAERPLGDAGVDCLGLLIGLARRLDLRGRDGAPIWAADALGYGARPDGAALQAKLAECLEVVAPESGAEWAAAGDILLFRLQGNPQHLGLRTVLADGRACLLHAYAPLGRVVEHGWGGPWPGRLAAVYRLPAAA